MNDEFGVVMEDPRTEIAEFIAVETGCSMELAAAITDDLLARSPALAEASREAGK